MKEKTRNTSARKKLVPAVAMLTTSAIMLSSATYAWFTLNKEVEVTGLQMAATAGDSLEISLGAITGGKYTTTAPGVDDTSWKRAITIDEYYASVGRLKPVSSDSATTLYKVDGLGIVQGGRAVVAGTEITAADDDDAADLVLDKDVAEGTDTAFKTVDDENAEGYYIDVPMWIRSNNRLDTTTPIDCTVTITDPTKDDPDNTGSDLIKAVRVAIIPAGTADTSTGIAALTPTVNNGVAQLGENLSASIYALDDTTYNEKKVIGGTGNYAVEDLKTTTLNKAADARTDTALDSDADPDNANITPLHTVFALPPATADDYAGAAFIARIWIEGESTYCNDATANQDWLIDFHFAIADATPSTGD